jgi:LPXTG-site transpeptidase (sortase) family protein
MRVSLRQTNNLLLGLIVAINLYVIAAPLLPQVTYWWQSHHTQRRAQLVQILHPKKVAVTPKAAPVSQPNSLVIPTMLLNQPVLEGPESDWFNILKAGIWHWPESSTPDKGGNTVFLAHRFSYTGPRGAFYFLNKLQPGDEIGVIWDNKTYTYKVTSSTEVPPTDTAVEANTSDARITLFTCTPLWNPVDRLVVVAELEKTP